MFGSGGGAANEILVPDFATSRLGGPRFAGPHPYCDEKGIHDRVAANIRGVLANRVRGTPFRVVGRGERVMAPPWSSLSPDLTLARVVEEAGPVIDPIVAIEVVSVDTARLDRILKNRAYRAVPGLLQYMMVSTDRPRIETVTLGQDGWLIDAVAGLDARVSLPGHGLHLFLSDVYAETGLT